MVRSMAERAGTTVTEAEGSYMIMISQPQIVVEAVLAALAAAAQKDGPRAGR